MTDNPTPEVKISVPADQTPKRIDKFIAENLPGVSRSYIQILIQEGKVSCSGKAVKASDKIISGQEITVVLETRPHTEVEPENIQIDIVYEDESLVVVNKPAGLVVHPAVGNWSGTLVNALMYHYNSLSTLSGETRPGIVHRLDKDTSGLMVVAKNDFVHAELSRQFADKSAGRIYQAVVWGVPAKEKQTIEGFIARNVRDRKKMMATADGGKWAVTHMSLIESFANMMSLCQYELATGRTHQIRVHTASIGFPVFGDPTYGGRKQGMSGLNQEKAAFAAGLFKEFKRQALHARKLSFYHPVQEKMVTFESELPADMRKLIEQLRDFR